jgi:hypothetical protein
MHASITTQKNGTVVATLDAEAARTTFACVIFAARIHEEIAPLARMVEQQLRIDGCGLQNGGITYASDTGTTR